MNMAASIPAKDERREDRRPVRSYSKTPAVKCPVCGQRGLCRSSEEISPTYRRLYYVCSNIECGMTWQASLSFERVISPSGVGDEFRPMQVDQAKPPGFDFGQMPP
ncbi:ogr/Delta-like zinc finger family protein [Aurantiacibacter suaedae]|uniref:ogr/Delta-like zinc finger family protein n=1 Tax=Aurantiacibacter suaedae TaxID=2545755 RepID=UPI0010FA61E4|nr:ogr/Delta-like zinc finger family protein [Aurantiacibacter suaedae]